MLEVFSWLIDGRSGLKFRVAQTGWLACLALSLSALFCGCADVQTPDRHPPEAVAHPVETAPAEVVPDEPAAPEPNRPAQRQIPPHRADLRPAEPPVEQVPPQDDPVVEPNEPEASEITDTVSAEPPEEIVPAEPNLPEAEQPAAAEPNEAPVEEPGPREPDTEIEDPGPLAAFYQEYGELLRQFVREDGRVDYESLRRKRLWIKQLLRTPDELDPNTYQGWTPEQKLAFWINTYNLKMLDVIARNYPIESSWWLRLTWPPSDIRHIEGIWSNYRFIVMDEQFTLGEVERRFFRRAVADPRAFLAITYASRSSPRFLREPYRGDDLGRQLDEQIRAFLSAGGGFRIDRGKRIVHLSALFKPTWRGKEFVARYGTDKKFKDRPPETRAVLNFLTRYVSDEDVYFLEVENYAIEYTNFDWRLNDTSRGY